MFAAKNREDIFSHQAQDAVMTSHSCRSDVMGLHFEASLVNTSSKGFKGG